MLSKDADAYMYHGQGFARTKEKLDAFRRKEILRCEGVVFTDKGQVSCLTKDLLLFNFAESRSTSAKGDS